MNRKAELDRVALGIFRGEIFTDRHCQRPEEVGMSFVILALMKKAQRTRLVKRLKGGGMVYEHISKAAPRSINGKPMFFSCHILPPKEAAYVLKKYEAIKKAVAEACNGAE